jgi:hypothetical protein
MDLSALQELVSVLIGGAATTVTGKVSASMEAAPRTRLNAHTTPVVARNLCHASADECMSDLIGCDTQDTDANLIRSSEASLLHDGIDDA